MKNAPDNDDTHTFQTLAAATAKLLTQDKKQDGDGSRDDRETQQRSERGQKPNREYVEQRLRDIAAFERRARGHQGPR